MAPAVSLVIAPINLHDIIMNARRFDQVRCSSGCSPPDAAAGSVTGVGKTPLPVEPFCGAHSRISVLNRRWLKIAGANIKKNDDAFGVFCSSSSVDAHSRVNVVPTVN